MATDGFHHRGRVVWPLRYTLEAPAPTVAELAVPLDAAGNAYNGLATAHPPDRPIVFVKPGEWLAFKGKPRLVLAVEVYRASWEI